ncbi:serine hydrolase domain-containing protein [Paraherbaspirillum soli]|uniref:Serine hydrolase domain-containing protein n=1 Tax=Paraherbaspirillum soli TaxID=631222 RepID=A0ABW0MAJ7_9BURK
MLGATISCLKGNRTRLWSALILITLAPFAAAQDPASAPASHTSEQIGTVQQVYDGKLLPDVQVNTFRHIDRLFPSRTVAHGAKVYPLAVSDKPLRDVVFDSAGKQVDLFDYISLNRVSGLLVIKNGKIAYENYELGNTPETRWMSMSIAKSITASLIAAAIKDGYIKSIDDPITRYLPKLNGSAYEGVTVRQLLQMASGVQWKETYTDPNSDRRHMLQVQSAQQDGAVLDLMAKLPRVAAPGTRWNYSTGETQVAGALVSAAVGKSESAYLSEKIWAKFGMESDATWWLESANGGEIGGSGIAATLRDYGRFGLFLLEDGMVDGERVLPEGWVKEASSPQTIGGQQVDYGYMLWPVPRSAGSIHASAFEARGIFGQHIYMNPAQKLVIVVWSARSKPSGTPPVADHDFFAAVARTLQ